MGIVADLRTLQPVERRQWFFDQDPDDRSVVLACFRAELGTPFAFWRDDPVGFIEDVLHEYLWSRQRMIARSVATNNRTACPACHGPGKALAHGTPVLTEHGWAKIEELRVGDRIYAADGTLTEVVGVFPQGLRPLYRLTFNDGSTIDADGDHQWATLRRRGPGKGQIDVQTTAELLWRGGSHPVGNQRAAFPSVQPVQFPARAVPLDPYLLGVLLGDGCLTKPTPVLATHDQEILDRIGHGTARPTKSRPHDYPLLGIAAKVRAAGIAGCRSWEKRVPDDYLWNAPDTRLAVLRGLMDTDGSCDARDGHVEFCTTSPQLAEDVSFLARSLGARVRTSSRHTTYEYLGERKTGRRSYRLSIFGGPCPFALTRKADRWNDAKREVITERLLISIEPTEPGLATCIAVAHSDRLFVTKDFLVSHNTWLAGRLVTWFCSVHAPGEALAVTTAKRWRQVRSQLWPHVRRAAKRADLPGRRNQTEWWMDDEQVAYGFAPDEYDEASAQGIHAPHLLIIVDEAGGIVPLLGGALNGLLVGDASILAIGNPPTDEESTWFQGICDSALWNTIPISAEVTPNFTGEECPPEVAAQLIDRRWVDDVIHEYGEDSAYYIARVLAQFPKVFARKVIPVDWCEDAMVNDHPGRSGWQRLGVDVASGGGDEMVLALGDGWDISIVDTWAGPESANQVTNAERVLPWILRAQGRQKQLGYTDRKVRVKVDGIGVGAGTADILERMGKEGLHEADIVKVIVSQTATDAGRFHRRRDEAWWTLREVLRDGTARLSIDEKTKAQLCGPTWKTNASGKIEVEQKDKMKARGVPSPDRADAVCLVVYEPEPVVESQTYDQLATSGERLRLGARHQ